MCFSASASFGSGVVLSIIGVAALRKTETSSQLALGCFPFIFAVQQFSEGFVWLSVTNPAYAGWQEIPAYSFLIFSHIVWPIWIPLAILLLEKNIKRKKILGFLLGTGIVLATYHVFCLIFLPVTIRVDEHHLQYLIAHPTWLLMIGNIFYGLSTILPSFISSVKRMWWLGAFTVVSYIVAHLFFQAYVISVWCYFATLLSVIAYLILARINSSRRKPAGNLF